MIGLHPIMGFFVEMTIKESKQDFGILRLGGVRSDAEQLELYKKGRGTKGPKVTWTYDSFHQYGLAVDLVAYDGSKFTWDEDLYDEIQRAGLAVIEKYDLPVNSGFEMWRRDLPHWQMDRTYKAKYDIRKIKS